MELEILKEKFYRLVAPSLPNEWDVEEALAGLTLDDAQQIEEIFAQIPAIWPVSHSLCFSYLSAAGPAVACLAPEELSLWVHGLLDCYETKGLRGAQLFMADVAEHFLRQIRGQGGLRLADIRPRLQTYVNGLAGRELTLVAAEAAASSGLSSSSRARFCSSVVARSASRSRIVSSGLRPRRCRFGSSGRMI